MIKPQKSLTVFGRTATLSLHNYFHLHNYFSFAVFLNVLKNYIFLCKIWGITCCRISLLNVIKRLTWDPVLCVCKVRYATQDILCLAFFLIVVIYVYIFLLSTEIAFLSLSLLLWFGCAYIVCSLQPVQSQTNLPYGRIEVYSN